MCKHPTKSPSCLLSPKRVSHISLQGEDGSPYDPAGIYTGLRVGKDILGKFCDQGRRIYAEFSLFFKTPHREKVTSHSSFIRFTFRSPLRYQSFVTP